MDENRQKEKINFYGALGMLVFSLAFFFCSVFFISAVKNAEWYSEPKLFPVIISVGLMVCSSIYLCQNRKGYHLVAEDWARVRIYFKGIEFRRLMIAIVLLALYVFVLLGLRIGSFHLPYEGATFTYLFLNMIIFRKKGFAVWKIIAISLFLSVVVGYGFSSLAKIPLP